MRMVRVQGLMFADQFAIEQSLLQICVNISKAQILTRECKYLFTFMEESLSMTVLDCGGMKTVCSLSWLEYYLVT